MRRKTIQTFCSLFALCTTMMPTNASWAMTADEATDAAFAALLQMPGAEPSLGGWTIPEQYYKPESQQQLIVFLGKMKGLGADFNAYRHLGTLLHHAIRANFIKTAQWLLDHGANPQLTLKSSNENAVDVSIRYGRVQLTQTLINQYHIKRNVKPAPPPAVPVMPATFTEADLETISVQNLSDVDVEKIRKVQRFFIEGRHYIDVSRVNKWDAFEASLPPEALMKVIDSSSSFSNFISFHALNTAGAQLLSKTLDDLPSTLTARYINTAISDLAKQASVGFTNEDAPQRTYSISLGTWQILWKHRDGAVDYSNAGGLAERVQPELWSDLFASGYVDRNAESALGCLLTSISAADFKATWKNMEQNFPNIREVAPRMVLNGQRMSGLNYCWDWHTLETVNKLRYLSSLGINEEVKGIDTSDFQSVPELSEAIKPFSKRTISGGAASLRLVDRKINCTLDMSLDWLGEINNPADNRAWYYTDKLMFSEDTSQSIYSVQIVDMPGSQNCALLVGSSFTQNGNSDPGGHDSFDGMMEPEPHPSCPSPSGGYSLLIEVNGKIEHAYTELLRSWNSANFIPVRDVSTGRDLFLRDEGGGGRCDSPRRLPGLYSVTTGRYGVNMERVKDRDIEEALFAQCKPDKGSDNADIVCKGIGQALTNPVFNESSGISYGDFLQRYYPDKLTVVTSVPSDRAPEYEVALIHRDENAAAAIRKSGAIPYYWVTSALRKMIEPGILDEEKRTNILWVLSDTERLTAVSTDIYFLNELLPWLERQDWQPILKRIEQPAPVLSSLREAAASRELLELACDIDHAQGLVCGEAVSF